MQGVTKMFEHVLQSWNKLSRHSIIFKKIKTDLWLSAQEPWNAWLVLLYGCESCTLTSPLIKNVEAIEILCGAIGKCKELFMCGQENTATSPNKSQSKHISLKNNGTVVLKLGSIEPLGFDGLVSGVRRRSSETCNPFLLSVILGKNGVRQNLGKLHKGSVCL